MTQSIPIECTKCQQSLPDESYYPRRYGGYRDRRCKACISDARRAYYVRTNESIEVRRRNLARYGLTPDQYDAMALEQDNRCAMCRLPERKVMNGKVTALCVDHDHVSGVTRGLLCNSCNIVLGFLEKHSGIGLGLLSYLMRYSILQPAQVIPRQSTV